MGEVTEPQYDLPYGIPAPGYRLPPATRPGRVRLEVADLERSIDWYRGVLGFMVSDLSADGASLSPAGSVAKGAAPLIELQERRGAAPAPAGGAPGLYHYAILLPDRPSLGRLLPHLAQRGVRPGASDHLVSEALYLNDPDGLGIEVYADRPRSAWRHRDRQLMMATEPLDTAALIDASGAEAWEGMPDGTTIGHVHLHVGDLAAASAFYHGGLGLDLMVWSYPGALFLSAGGYHHHLGLNTWARRTTPAADGDARLLEWELVMPTAADARAALASLASAGFSVENGRARDPWGIAVHVR
ncbi:MAG: VOC family protein [Gemmatimonadota bacterium]